MRPSCFPLPLCVEELADGSKYHFRTESDFVFLRRVVYALKPAALDNLPRPSCPDDFLLVPAGFRTDFASVPGLLRGALDTDNEVSPAALVHDWLYTSQLLPRDEADEVFRVALIANHVPAWKARVYWLGVRAGGWIQWGKRPGEASDALALLAEALERRGLN